MTPGNDSVADVFADAGFAWHIARRVSLFGTAEYTALSDSSGFVSGKSGVRVTF